MRYSKSLNTSATPGWKTLLPDNKCGEFPAERRTGSLSVSGTSSIKGVSNVLMVQEQKVESLFLFMADLHG